MDVIQKHTLLDIHSKFNNIEIINQMLNNSNLFPGKNVSSDL
jgi:hypothetical protein